jgi:Mg-chelatase subunit ChlD
MNPDIPMKREELEAKVTALLLGELPDNEAALLRELIARDPGLARLQGQLKVTLELLRETAAAPEPLPAAPLKLSEAKREKLLAHFKTVAPKEFAPAPRRRISLLEAVAIIAAVAVLASLSIPNFVKARATSPQNAIINNLRWMESAKQQWALEKGKSPTDVPSMTDLQPYLGRGAKGEIPRPVEGEYYNIGAVGQPPVARLVTAEGQKKVITLPGEEGNLASVNEWQAQGTKLKNGMLTDTVQPAQAAQKMLTSNGVWPVPSVRPPAPIASPAPSQIILPAPAAETAAAAPPEFKMTFYDGPLPGNRYTGNANSQSTTATPALASDDSIAAKAPGSMEELLRRRREDKLGLAIFGGDRNGQGSSNRDGSKESGGPELLGEIPRSGGGRRGGGGSVRGGGGGGIGGGGGGAGRGFGGGGAISSTTSPIDRPANGQVGSADFYVDKDTGQVFLLASRQRVTASELATNAPVSQAASQNVYSINGVGYINVALPPVANIITNALFDDSRSVTATVDGFISGGNFTITNSGNLNFDDSGKIVTQPAVPTLTPQPEVLTSTNIFSTFSLNVSDAAFKLAQASLQNGTMPDAAGIRSEEFINAFDYRDPEPAPGAPIGFAWDRAAYPFAHNRDLLRFSVKTAAQGRQAGRPLNLVLLLDKSGSMERADRVEIIHQALRVLASQLSAQDTLSVVVFARTARLWVDGAPGSQAGDVANRLDSLTPEGGTNLEEAMRLAYATALRHYKAAGENRVVLMTDGAANLGDVQPESLKQRVEANRAQGIALDCFGIGWDGYNDNLMETLSRTGHGRYGFINTPEEAATEFAGKLAGALRVAASDVKVQVEFNPNRVTSYRQIGYAKHQLTKEQFRDNSVAAAQIGAAESGTALYTVEIAPLGDGPLCTVRVRFHAPGSSDYQEHAWDVPYNGTPITLDQASPAMRLAATASAFSEWLAASPYAGEVTSDQLLAYLRGVPELYGADARPKNLEWMIRQAKSISGK